MNRNKLSILILNTFVFSAAWVSPALAHKLVIINNTTNDTSRPISEAAPLSNPEDSPEQSAPRPYVPPVSLFNAIETNTTPTFKLSNLPLKGFQGVGIGLGDFQPVVSPPDTNGSVGRTQYVQWTNAFFGVFDKATGKILPGFPKAGSALFSGFGGLCETTNRGDGIIKYDQFADRWIISKFAFSDPNAGPWFQCIAVSTTSDASGSYYRYAYQYDSLNDYGKLGLWSDAYYLTSNMVGPTVMGPRICALNRNAMLAGQSAGMICITLDFMSAGSALLPADLDGKSLPPPGTPEYLMSLQPPNGLRLFKFSANFTNPSQSTLSAPVIIPVNNFIMPCAAAAGDNCVPQPDTTTRLDAATDRLMNRLAYRQFQDHGTLVATHTVQGMPPTNASVIRWYEIRVPTGSTNPTLYQQGNHGILNNGWGFSGSIATDKMGNIAFGYSKSSATLYPSIGISARLVNAPLGKLSISTTALNGTGSQGNNNTRWGDYSGMSVDPVDDCTFWYTNEYFQKGAFMWSTYITYFKMPNCV